MEYYIIQVATGREQTFINNIKKMNTELINKYDFIYLTRELTIKRQGKWLKEQQPIFPSYIIVQSEALIDSKALTEFKKIPDFYYFLNSNKDIVPLSNSDLALIKRLIEFGPKIGSSLICFDENERIVVIEGPLKGMEGNIIKVDRRKQRAKICIDFLGTSYTMDLGFEDISKHKQ